MPNDPGVPYVMQGLEIATGVVMGGPDPNAVALEAYPATAADVRDALEDGIVAGLNRPPCLVAFSGGRDSSGVLAAATLAARRHGLPLPIPATNRFPGVPAVDETAWQELVVRHLGLEDWVRVDVTDDLDIIGPAAASLLRRHGVLWPFNAHFMVPLAQRAGGGTLLTGVGGDELFVPSATRAAVVLARRARPRRSDARAVAEALAPRSLRRRRLRPKLAARPWLRPVAEEAAAKEIARSRVAEPLWWGRSVVDHWWRSRARRGVVASLAAAAGDQVVVEHPFMHPAFVSRVAAFGGRLGFLSRDAAMDALFGDVLPEAIRRRQDKAAFFQPFVHRYSRAFIESWDGSGLDADLVDVDALRRTWRESSVDARTYNLLQAAWLAAGGPEEVA